MYRVLIVDDEPIICEGLRKGVRWSEFNCEVVGTAANGMEGLERVKELDPDILISDISMNNMDGLAMVAAIKSERPDMEVTLLTGYRNFEYAQRAIKLGVTRFLLKPSRMDEIEEAILAMTANLRSIGNMGAQIIDHVWNMQDAADRYLYETFIKSRPDDGGESGSEEHSEQREQHEQRDQREQRAEGRIRDSEANQYVLKSALVYIFEHYTGKLSLGDVAEHCYVSSWHLSKLLNHYTGRGFFEIINRIRIDKAKELLAEGRARVQEVSDAVGFLDVAHFSRIFKSYVGCSPKEYRGRS